MSSEGSNEGLSWDDASVKAWLQSDSKLREGMVQALGPEKSIHGLSTFLQSSGVPKSIVSSMLRKAVSSEARQVDARAFKQCVQLVLKHRPIVQRAARRFDALKPGSDGMVATEPLRKQLRANAQLSENVRTEALNRLSHSDRIDWDKFYGICVLLSNVDASPSSPRQSDSHMHASAASQQKPSNGAQDSSQSHQSADAESNDLPSHASNPFEDDVPSNTHNSADASSPHTSYYQQPQPQQQQQQLESQDDQTYAHSENNNGLKARANDEQELRSIRSELKQLRGRALVLWQDRTDAQSTPEIESLRQEVGSLESKIEDLCSGLEHETEKESKQLNEEYERLQKRKAELAQEKEEKEQSLEASSHELHQLRDEVARAEEDVRNEKETCIQPLEARLTQAAEERKRLENLKIERKEEESSLSEQKASLKAKLELTERDIESSNARADELEEELEQHRQENDRLEEQLAKKQNERDDAHNRLTIARQNEHAERERMQQLREKVYETEQDVWDTESKRSLIINRTDAVQSTSKDLKEALDESVQRLAHSIVVLSVNKALLHASEEEESALEENLSEAHQCLAKSQEDEGFFLQQQRWVNARVQALEARIDSIRDELSELDSSATLYQEECYAETEEALRLERETERLQDERDQLHEEVVRLQSEYSASSSRKAYVESRMKLLKSQVDSLRRSNEEVEQNLKQLDNQETRMAYSQDFMELERVAVPPHGPRIPRPQASKAGFPGQGARLQKACRNQLDQEGDHGENANTERSLGTCTGDFDKYADSRQQKVRHSNQGKQGNCTSAREMTNEATEGFADPFATKVNFETSDELCDSHAYNDGFAAFEEAPNGTSGPQEGACIERMDSDRIGLSGRGPSEQVEQKDKVSQPSSAQETEQRQERSSASPRRENGVRDEGHADPFTTGEDSIPGGHGFNFGDDDLFGAQDASEGRTFEENHHVVNGKERLDPFAAEDNLFAGEHDT